MPVEINQLEDSLANIKYNGYYLNKRDRLLNKITAVLLIQNHLMHANESVKNE